MAVTRQDFGPYHILEKLGQGAMGEVYRAHDARLGRDVAVKLLPPEFRDDPERLRRFEQEARAAAALNHQNILAVHDIGTQDGVPYFVTELLTGETLRARLSRGPLTVSQVADYGAQLARGLAAAHERGIVHRDVKPDNLFLTTDGRLKILDFGIAKSPSASVAADTKTVTAQLLTEPGAIVGTMPYMSPEQVRGAPTDGRSDTFAVGAVLFEMLTGDRAFDAPSASETMSAVLTRDPIAAAQSSGRLKNVPPALVEIVRHCLEKEPRDRFQSARDIAFGLDVLSGASGTNPAVNVERGHRRSAWLLVCTGLVAMAVVAMLVWRFRTPSAAGPPTPVTKAADTPMSIAMLPLANLSGNPGDEYFADGMTDSLITELARAPGLAVIARSAVFRYKEQAVDPQQAGRQLGARYVLHGGVQRASERVRVNVRLVDVTTGVDVLGEPFEGETKDLFALQDKISRRIVDVLRLRLSASNSGRRPTTNEQAYDAYLQGVYYRHRQSTSREAKENLDHAIAFFEHAVAEDPQFALAQANLASAYSRRFFYYDADRQWEQKAFLCVEKALAIDPNLAEAYLARALNAWSLSSNFPHEKAVRDLQRAIAINPSLADAHRELARIYTHIGLLDRAIDELSQALRLDPGDLEAQNRRVTAYVYARECTTALQMQDGSDYLRLTRAETLRCLGRTDEALAQLSPEGAPKTSLEQGLLVVLLARKADVAAARRQIALVSLGATNFEGQSHLHHVQYYLGVAHALLGETREAVSWLKKASREGFPCYPLFERDRDLDGIRQDPEFAEFMQQLKAQVERLRSAL